MNNKRKALREMKTFRANNTEYHFNFDLPIARFREFQKLKLLVQFAVKDESQLFDDFRTIYENVNGDNLDRHEILKICHNNMHGLKNAVDSQFHAILQLAALFINRRDEDETQFNIVLNNSKIEDWAAEGLYIADFFFVSASLIKNFTSTLTEQMIQKAEQTKVKSTN